MTFVYLLLIIAFAAIQVLMVVKFFQIAEDVRLQKDISLSNYKNKMFDDSDYLELKALFKGLTLPNYNVTSILGGENFKFEGDKEMLGGIFAEKHSLLTSIYVYYIINDDKKIYFPTKDEAIKGLYLILSRN